MLSYKETELIKDYLKRNKSFNLNDLCKYLIDNGSSAESYSTGKLKIYPLVAVFIKTFMDGIESEIFENNVFFVIKGELPGNVEFEKKELPSEIGQLSLF